MKIVDDCPWKRVLDIWPDPLLALADASIIAVAMTNRYDAAATFDPAVDVLRAYRSVESPNRLRFK